MPQINIIGSITDSSGYSIHTRELANALNKITDVRLSAPIPQQFVNQLNDKELEMLKRKKTNDEINLIITSPTYWRLHTNAKRNWVYCVWEGDKVPKFFIEECLNPDIEKILVPSEHTKQAILKTLMDEWSEGKQFTILDEGRDWDKIKIIPHGVDLEKFYPKEKPKEFTFLVNKGFRNLEDRGGTQYFIKAYLEEFKSSDNINAIVKINPAYGIPDLNNIINTLKPKDKTDLPKLSIDVGNYPHEKLVELYNKGHVFVMPTRAEAFGIPGIEAMACGLPVITTSFGGQTDYCNKENSWIIEGTLTKMNHELQYEGISWLTPDLKELKKAMREAYTSFINLENPRFVTTFEKCISKKSEESLETSKQFTWENSANKIKELI